MAVGDLNKNVADGDNDGGPDSDEERSERTNRRSDATGAKAPRDTAKRQTGLLKSASGYLKVSRVKKSSKDQTDPKKTAETTGESSSKKARTIELKLLKPDQPEVGSDEEEKKIEEDEADR